MPDTLERSSIYNTDLFNNSSTKRGEKNYIILTILIFLVHGCKRVGKPTACLGTRELELKED